MTTLFNDPENFADDQLDGFVDLYSDRLLRTTGGVVTYPPKKPQVAVIVGGGSGHYPAFAGLVGPGFASGAVVGNIFTSPSAAYVYSVAKAADQGKGVVLTFGNYAGDNMNFGIAAEMLRAEGIDTRIVVVKDDIASAKEFERRRGIAGDFTVFKIMGAAAAAGMSLDEVERLGNLANHATRTMGVAFSGCTMPGAKQPLFNVENGMMGVGLGIHGEPGIHDEKIMPAAELARLLVANVLNERPENAGNKATVIVNGLGTTKYEELFVLYHTVAQKLREAGIEIIEPEVGELVTSLDMGGTSLTVMWIDEDFAELEPLWRAEAYACAYRKDNSKLDSIDTTFELKPSTQAPEDFPDVSPGMAPVAQTLRTIFPAIAELMIAQEEYLGRIDAIAADGDHGRGMVKGATAARDAVATLPDTAGPRTILAAAGRAWAALAGGTSGVLWGASLEAAGATLDDTAPTATPADLAEAIEAFSTSMMRLGGAKPGMKTLLDSLIPFQDAVVAKLRAPDADLAAVWKHGAAVATQAAEDTKNLRPEVGRARPLAEKSLNHPDPGAVSMAMIIDEVSRHLH